MRDALFVLDNAQRVVDLNPAALDLVGMARTTALRREWAGLLSEARPPATLAAAAAAQPIEIQMPCNGVTRTYEVQASPIANWSQRSVGWAVLLHDVTDRVLVEEEMLRLNRELELRVGQRTAELAAELAERKRAEEDMRRLKDLHEGIVNGMSEGIALDRRLRPCCVPKPIRGSHARIRARGTTWSASDRLLPA